MNIAGENDCLGTQVKDVVFYVIMGSIFHFNPQHFKGFRLRNRVIGEILWRREKAVPIKADQSIEKLGEVRPPHR